MKFGAHGGGWSRESRLANPSGLRLPRLAYFTSTTQIIYLQFGSWFLFIYAWNNRKVRRVTFSEFAKQQWQPQSKVVAHYHELI